MSCISAAVGESVQSSLPGNPALQPRVLGIVVRQQVRYSRDMGVSLSYREYVADQLSALSGIITKRMFGGVGLYFDGRMFGLIDDDTVFLRVDDATRLGFLERGMQPFHPLRSNPQKVSHNYYQLPADVLEDNEQLVVWAQRAIQASLSPTAAVANRANRARKRVSRRNA